MSDGIHPFWKADATPDSKATAIIAIAFFLALAGAFLAFAPSKVSVILAGVLIFQAVRMWRRFRSHTAKT